ncbi:MAG: TlpA family protein disulfide reductase [Pyrinomonadaceae bacterium]|nr:TlpA family protein disulfide reductase [Phycisphaerales bacterium]
MHRRLASLSAAFLLAVAGSTFALAAPPTDEQVAAAGKSFQEKMTQQRNQANEKKTQLTREAFTTAADEALKDVDISALSMKQIKTLQESFVLAYSSKTKELSARLGELAKEPGVEGFEAASMGLMSLRATESEQEQLVLVRTALKHPGFSDAVKAGKGSDVFRSLGAAKPAVLKQVIPDILALEPALTSDLSPAAIGGAVSIMDALNEASPDEVATKFQPMRAKLLSLVQEAAKKPDIDDRTKKMLARQERRLDGAYMKGMLIGHPAPQMDITWSNMEPSVKSLADLKGKVVVLDFWATWCGPCTGSFPDVKKLQEHYEGYPVVIVGITSPQGRFVTADQDEAGKAITIDCKDDVTKEQGLMPAYIKSKDINWKIAFTKQDVFNPDYDINGIPHVAIIDAKGNVRHRALHPNSRVTPFAEKVDKIDALLKEAGLPAPQSLPKEEKKEAPAKGG